MEDLSKNELFSAYLDGELTAEEQAHVERLLSENADARQLMDELRTLSSTLQALPQYTLGEGIHRRVLQMAEKEMAAERRKTEAPKATAVEQSSALTARHRARRFLSPRALVWSTTAVALAIAVAIFNPEQPRDSVDNSPLAMSPVGSGGDEESKENVESVEPFFGAAPDDSTRKKRAAPRSSTVGRYAGEAGKGGGFTTETAAETAPGPLPTKPGFETGGVPGDRNLKTRSALKSAAKGTLAGPDQGVGKGGLGYGGGQSRSFNAGDLGGIGGQLDVNGSSTAGGGITDGGEPLLAKQYEKDARAGRENASVAVIQCAISRKAMDGGVLRKALLANGITAGDTYSPGSEPSAMQARSKSDHGKLAKAAEVAGTQAGGIEVLYVEATSEQIEATLLAMAEQPQTFYSVSVEPAPEVQEQKHWTSFESRGLRRQFGSSLAPAAAVDAPIRGSQVRHDLKRSSSSLHLRTKAEGKLAPDSPGEGHPQTPAAETADPLKDEAPASGKPGSEKAHGEPAPRPADVPEKPVDKRLGRPTARPTNGPGGATTSPAAPKTAVPGAKPAPAEGAPLAGQAPADTLQTAGDESSVEAEGTAEGEADGSARREPILSDEKSQDAEKRDAETEDGENARRLGIRQPHDGRPEADRAEEPSAEETRQKEVLQREGSERPGIDRERAGSLQVENELDSRTDRDGARQRAAPPSQPASPPTYRVLFVVRTIDTDIPAATASAIRAAEKGAADAAMDADAAETEVPRVEAKGRQ